MIGMASMMGGAMRAPFTATIFVLETTHDLSLLPALLAACVVADGCTVLLLRRSILTEKVARRGRHLSYEYGVDVADVVRVGEVMDTTAPAVPAALKVGELGDRIARGDTALTRQAFPILDEGGHLVGLITRGEVLRALDGRSEAQPHQTVLQAGRSQVAVAYPDEVLSDAVARMLRDRLDRLPVVTRDDSSLYLGYLGRAEVLGARRRQLAEEQREPGWLHHAIHRNGSG
jgi:CBS domain-containing protein